jgi:ABC-type dipeptide/oligopeptide/nickel transport system ATPase component
MSTGQSLGKEQEELGSEAKLLSVEDLCIDFYGRGGRFRAVDGVSFSLDRGCVLALVGESGSGKSVTGLALTRLLPDPPQCRVSGRILFQGRDLMALPRKAVRAYRGRIAYVFQETGSALNPVFSVGHQIAEAVRLHQPQVRDVRSEVVRALDLVGIANPEQRAESYPHQLSGGMQQRAMIAMALACRPELLVADEPTTGLDVTIQAQIVALLRDLQQRLGMAVLLITHDFGVVSGFADHVAVMRQGRIVERGETERILHEPRHPYTRALIACIPVLGSQRRRLPTIDTSQ